MSTKGEENGTNRILKKFNHKGNHKVGCYSKSLLIFTTYQVQGWWNMVIIPVRFQPDGSNIRKVLINISWHTQLRDSKPYTFIVQK